MRRIFIALFVVSAASANAQWLQWGRDPQHTGVSSAAAQPLTSILDAFGYDPFVSDEVFAGGGDLFVHYQAPIVDGDDVFMETKAGVFNAADWRSQTWNLNHSRWVNGRLADQWTTPTDWKAAPPFDGGGGPQFEPVFHALVNANGVFMPASGGTIVQVDRNSGAIVKRINPFSSIDSSIYVTGPLTSDANGNIYYNAIQFNTATPYSSDVRGAWLVKVNASGVASRVAYSDITPGTPRASDMCIAAFTSALPWPPSPTAVPESIPCGSQRPGLNVAPAIGADGTIYTVSRAHFDSRYSSMVAVNPNLTPKWITSMRDRFNDGCNVIIPPNGTAGGCRAGAITGVDPADNTRGAGRVVDDASSCPVVAPDGSVFYGAFTQYNYGQGHMMHFAPDGTYLGNYSFGWDITPAIDPHGATYSLITKENHYVEAGTYCGDEGSCPPARPEAYFITSLSPSLAVVEWQFKSTNTQSCHRNSNGTISCESDHPNGFEWCVNAPAVDRFGRTYVNSEDGFVYAIDSTGHEVGHLFLQLALGAAYTPLSIDAVGRVYTQNAGVLFVVGGPFATPPRRHAAGH